VGEVDMVDVDYILATDGSKVWIKYTQVYTAYRLDDTFGLDAFGLDFGTPGSSPVKLSSKPPDRVHLNDTKFWETNTSRMKDRVTEKVIFQLPEEFGRAVHVQWGGRYLVVCFRSRAALILDFSHVSL